MTEKDSYSKRNIINDDVVDYMDRKFRPVNQKLWRMRLDSENRYVPIMQRDVESLMITYLKTLRPSEILEIGTAIGYSLTVMAETVPESHIVSLEKDLLMYKKATETVEQFGLEERVSIIRGDARKSLVSLKEEVLDGKRRPFEFVFIDASKSHYREFWDIIMDIIRPGSIIMCDNVLMRGMTIDDSYDIYNKHKTNIRKMRAFLDHITGLGYADTAVLPVGDGVSVSYIKER